MDAHLFRLFAETSARFFTGAMLEKIQEPQPGLLTFSMFNQGEKRQFIFHYGKRQPFCFFTGMRLPAGGHPSARIMRIRKYFAQRRIGASVFQHWQRKIWLMASGQRQEDGKNPWLCLDFVKEPTLFFLDETEVPENDIPHWPEMEDLPVALEKWREWSVLTPALRKTLLRQTPLDQLALLRDLEAGCGDVFLYKKESQVVQISPWPLAGNLASGLTENIREDILPAMEEAGRDLVLAPVYQRREIEQEARIKKKLLHFNKLLVNLENDEKKLRKMVAGEERAKLIQANLWQIDAARHVELLEIGGMSPIQLDRRFSILENMRRLFGAAARGKRGLKILLERRAQLMAERAEIGRGAPVNSASESNLKNGHVALASGAVLRNLPREVAGFRSSDGFILLRGKSAKGNALVRRIAAPHDLWAHVEQGQGAHVVIRCNFPGQKIPERTLEEAGSLAASKSWLSGSDQAAVMYAEIRHVKPIRKGGEGNVAIDRLAFTKLVPVRAELEETLALG